MHSVPKGITAMSKLLNCASNGRDFSIDQIKKEHVPLMNHPESFRRTLGQLANDYYGAFMLAHKNMENIQLQMGQVPGYVEVSIDIIQFTNEYGSEKLTFGPALYKDLLIKWGDLFGILHSNLLIILENIKKIADNGLNLSTEVTKAFDKLGKLNQQVLLAITASRGAREREIKDAIHAKIKKEMDCQLKATELKQLNIQRQLADAREKVRSSQQELEEARQFGVGNVFGFFIFSLPLLAVRIRNAQTALNVAEERLQEIQQEAKRAEEESDKIHEEFTNRFDKMHVDAEKDKSRDEMIELLKEGMDQLSKLNSNWAGFSQNFNSINNYIEQVTQRALTDFVEDAAQEDTSMIDFSGPINKALECSKKTHQTAKMYVEFSNNQIMKSLNEMQRYKNALPSY